MGCGSSNKLDVPSGSFSAHEAAGKWKATQFDKWQWEDYAPYVSQYQEAFKDSYVEIRSDGAATQHYGNLVTWDLHYSRKKDNVLFGRGKVTHSTFGSVNLEAKSNVEMVDANSMKLTTTW
eukprot:CAMPEP_0113822272 /NCGR_PEP_ID=MMETSP0328-20130328/2158_1 /TAXON_ID=39455 /ORGANISM="Alexandrium minutum" /LENGTH=120 /DNA_ID=CAMNT_0000790209 /DNA_START=105 /DNA_END=464 /DNA_ORIENTATION=- /assembly_acc=CAM_ASM_000350